MKFCQNHWDKLKALIEASGVASMISRDASHLGERLKAELEGKPVTIESFDPLMAAHNMITMNTMEMLRMAGQNPLVLFQSDICPICHLNELHANHDRTCTNPDCKKPKGQNAEWMIDRAAQESVGMVKAMNGLS